MMQQQTATDRMSTSTTSLPALTTPGSPEQSFYELIAVAEQLGAANRDVVVPQELALFDELRALSEALLMLLPDDEKELDHLTARCRRECNGWHFHVHPKGGCWLSLSGVAARWRRQPLLRLCDQSDSACLTGGWVLNPVPEALDSTTGRERWDVNHYPRLLSLDQPLTAISATAAVQLMPQIAAVAEVIMDWYVDQRSGALQASSLLSGSLDQLVTLTERAAHHVNDHAAAGALGAPSLNEHAGAQLPAGWGDSSA